MGGERKRCPRCEAEYTGPPALSRADNATNICSDCGLKEALEAFLGWEHPWPSALAERAVTRCDRCHKEAGAFTTSYFNTDTVCMVCCERERAHPEFEHAQQIEIEACKRGNYNFPGVGCPFDLLGPEPQS